MEQSREHLTLRRRAAAMLRELKRLHPRAKIALRFGSNWELLVAVILSAQCTDKKVNEVTVKLFKKYRALDDYANANQREFERDIYQTGFFRAKAKNIIAAAKLVRDRFHGKLPKTMAEMLELPGVARKTANVVLGNAYGVVEGVAVDTHVRRLSRLFGLTRHSDPVKIERDLVALLPKKEWYPFTYRMIDYGRTYCPARCRHETCPLRRYVVLRRR